MHLHAQNATKPAEIRSLKSRSLAYLEENEPAIRVPVTQIAAEPSPVGTKNAPLQVYRTAGPGRDPVDRLPPFRDSCIEDRADTETDAGRVRNLLDDGKSALRRGKASAKWKGTKPEARQDRKARHPEALRPGRNHHSLDALRGPV